jgi:hypothetical protein
LRLVVDWPRPEPPNDSFGLNEYRVRGQRWIGYERDDLPTRRTRTLFGPLEGAPTIAFDARISQPGLASGCWGALTFGPTPGVELTWSIDGIGNVLRRALAVGAIDNVDTWLQPIVEFDDRWE